MARFEEVLKNRNFFFLWLGQVISQFGDRLNQMSLIALIYARAPGSTLQLAKIISFTIIPVFLVGPVAASYVDRWDRRRTMIACDLSRCVLVGLLVVCFIKFKSLWPVYLIIFLVFSISRFFVPAKMAIIPELVPQDNLLLANSLSSTTGMIAAVAGFGLGGVIVEKIGWAGGFAIDALTYLVSGLFIVMIATRIAAYAKIERPAQAIGVRKLLKQTLLGDIKEGWRYLAQDRQMRFVSRIFFLLWSALGAVYVVIIVFVQKTLGSITQDLGVLAMFLGLGLLLGSLIYGRFGEKVSRAKMIFISLAAAGLVLTIFAVFLKFLASALFASALSFALGLVLAPIIISSNTFIHEVVREEMRGRVFGALEIVAHLAFLLFMFLSSFLADMVERFWILLFVGAVLTVVGLGAIILKLDRRVLNNVQV